MRVCESVENVEIEIVPSILPSITGHPKRNIIESKRIFLENAWKQSKELTIIRIRITKQPKYLRDPDWNS